MILMKRYLLYLCILLFLLCVVFVVSVIVGWDCGVIRCLKKYCWKMMGGI